MKLNKTISDGDFFNYYNSLNKEEKSKIIGLPVTYHINCDSYADSIKEIKRNGRTIITKKGREMTLRNETRFVTKFNKDKKVYEDQEIPTPTYRNKGYNFGSLSIGEAYTRLDPHF